MDAQFGHGLKYSSRAIESDKSFLWLPLVWAHLETAPILLVIPGPAVLLRGPNFPVHRAAISE